MQLDVVIDVVCPWCYVGKKQLDLALASCPDLEVDVWVRPYQLGPDTPVAGVDRKTYYASKFPNTEHLAAMREHLQSIAKGLGITFDFDSECRIANTLDAHRLILWARAEGAQSTVVDDLMKRYFEDCAFLGDHALLADVADKAGMDAALVADLLKTDKDCELISAQVEGARHMGINGVPTYIFNEKSAISGAQGVDALIAALKKVAA